MLKNLHISLYKELVILAIAMFFLPLFPFLFLATLGLALVSRQYEARNLVLVLILLFFVVLNGTRSIDGDLEYYLNIYTFLNTHSLADFFNDQDRFLVSFRLSEIVWYSFTWLVSNITNGNIFLFIAVITIIIYSLYARGLQLLSRSFGNTATENTLVLLFGCLVCINFSETSHLIRQYICGSAFFLQFMLFYRKQYLKCLFVLLPTMFVHNSIVVPFMILLLSYVIYNQPVFRNRITRVFILPLGIGLFVGKLLSGIIILFNYEVSEQDNALFISMSLDIFSYLAAVVYLFRTKEKKPIVEGYLIFTLIVACCLYFLRDNMTLYLRFYLYLEWFRIFGFISLFKLLPSFNRTSALYLASVIACWLFFLLRMSRSPWTYGIDLMDVLNRSLFQVVTGLAY